MYPFNHTEVYRSVALTRFPLMDSHTTVHFQNGFHLA